MKKTGVHEWLHHLAINDEIEEEHSVENTGDILLC
jgi:hypothetical protein